MLELMKALGFVPESRGIKLYNRNGQAVGERYDRVTYLRETLQGIRLSLTSAVYVEADRFLPLLPFADKAEQTQNYLLVTLRNGAEYKLPYLDMGFDRPQIDTEPTEEISGTLDFTLLKKTALQNLVKPEMRCIYVDGRGAITCDFLKGTVDGNIRTRTGNALLLPPDLISYLSGEERGGIFTAEDYLLYTDGETKWIWAPKSEITEEENPWYESIYAQAQVEESLFVETPQGMEDALKRLACFGTSVTFSTNMMTTEENFEPLVVTGGVLQGQGRFTIEEVLSVISAGKKIYFSEDAMFLRNGQVIILVSKEEEQE